MPQTNRKCSRAILFVAIAISTASIGCKTNPELFLPGNDQAESAFVDPEVVNILLENTVGEDVGFASGQLGNTDLFGRVTVGEVIDLIDDADVVSKDVDRLTFRRK